MHLSRPGESHKSLVPVPLMPKLLLEAWKKRVATPHSQKYKNQLSPRSIFYIGPARQFRPPASHSLIFSLVSLKNYHNFSCTIFIVWPTIFPSSSSSCTTSVAPLLSLLFSVVDTPFLPKFFLSHFPQPRDLVVRSIWC